MGEIDIFEISLPLGMEEVFEILFQHFICNVRSTHLFFHSSFFDTFCMSTEVQKYLLYSKDKDLIYIKVNKNIHVYLRIVYAFCALCFFNACYTGHILFTTSFIFGCTAYSDMTNETVSLCFRVYRQM